MAADSRRSTVRAAVIAAFVASLASLAPLSARAQESGVDYVAAMRQGTERYEQGDTLGAIQIWERLLASLGEERAWKTLYNLGLAYQKIGDPTRAVERLDAFVKRSSHAEGKDLEERRQDASDRLKAIRATHAEIHVVAPREGGVVLVRIGSAEPRPAGFVVFLAPGSHDVELDAGTSRAKVVKVQAVAGAVREVVVPTTTAEPGKDKAQPAPPAREERSFPTGWLIAGSAVTVASGALPLVLGLRTASARDDAASMSTASSRYPNAVTEFEDARQLYHLSFIVPAVFAVATAVIVVLKLPSKSTTTANARWSSVIEF
jgi:hypothetical protein